MSSRQSQGGGPSGAERAAIQAADRRSGELRAAPTVMAALVNRGLARRHGTTGRHYLTESGRALRGALLQEAPGRQETSERVQSMFAPMTGDEVLPAELEALDQRGAEVAAAWAGVLEMRRVEVTGDGPCAWERAQPVRAVALALEAAGVRLRRGTVPGTGPVRATGCCPANPSGRAWSGEARLVPRPVKTPKANCAGAQPC